MKKYFVIMLFFAIASEAIAQNEINLDKIFTKDNLTELPNSLAVKLAFIPFSMGS